MCVNMQKGFFLGGYFLSFWFFVGNSPKGGCFLPILEIFPLWFPQSHLFETLLLLSLFSFCPPFQIPSFLFPVCPATPFGKTFLGFVLSLFLPFPFLMFASVFQTNFPNIPFSNPICSNFWLVVFLLLLLFLLFLFSCVMFLFSFFMLVLSLVCFPFFLFCFLFYFQIMKKNIVPCNSSVFCIMLVKR